MPWPVHPNGLLGAQGGDNDTYQISRSLRFNSADSAYLSRTPTVNGNQKTATLSLWVKKTKSTPVARYSILTDSVGSGSIAWLFFNSSDQLQFYINGAGDGLTSSAVYRDPSAWYHIVCAIDTTQATNTNRIKLYVNGNQITQFSGTTTYYGQDATPQINITSREMRLGQAGSDTFDGYMAECYWIDGQALTPSSFGETDAITGRWKAKAYSGTYGTNGFYLKFADNSGTTATTLGKDSAGTNNWTPNNFSVTAGVGNDSLVDSPTNYGTDSYSTSVDNARGCYCTLNPIHLAGATLSNGNLSATCPTGTTYYFARGTFGIPQTGKWYWETTITTVGLYPVVGVVAATNQEVSASDSYVGKTTNSAGWFGTIDAIYVNGSAFVSSLPSLSNGDVIMCAVSDNKVYLGRNGTWANSGNPITGTGSVLTATADLIPAITVRGTPTAPVLDLNFGQRPFAYTAPAGFKALCTTNLTTPTIKKPSSYMDVVTYTGTGASNSISSLGFSPDLVWIKNRGGATSHALYDTTRGTGSQLSSDTTGDEATSSTGLTAFGSNGFTIGTSTLVNTSGTQYVAWAWDESPQDGFDIVSYTGNGANRTINHNLGVAPKMLIVKARTTAGADQGWPVWHTSIANTTYLQLNSTSATATGADYWNSTSPTSSVFSVGANAAVNTNADTYIAYCFSEIEGYSKFGSYTGNGLSDGPFVWCGFRPRLVMIKASSLASTNWIMFDAARGTYNQINDHLGANTSSAENFQTNESIDVISSGIKIRNTNNDINGSGYTYIFAAFAEAPFKYARAR